MDPNGTCRDVVRYFTRWLSCAMWGIPDRGNKADISIWITSQEGEECVLSAPLPGSSHVCWAGHVNSSLFSATDLKKWPEMRAAFLKVLINHTELCLFKKGRMCRKCHQLTTAASIRLRVRLKWPCDSDSVETGRIWSSGRRLLNFPGRAKTNQWKARGLLSVGSRRQLFCTETSARRARFHTKTNGLR